MPGRDGAAAPWSRSTPARGQVSGPLPPPLPGPLGLLALGSKEQSVSLASGPPGSSVQPSSPLGNRVRVCPERSGYLGLPKRVIECTALEKLMKVLHRVLKMSPVVSC